MSDLVKMEGGSPYPDWCFLDRLDSTAPSTWGLRTHELVHGQYLITKRQLNRASAALLSPGYMGNRSHVLSHGLSFNGLRERMMERYHQIGVPEYEIPGGLFPGGKAPAKPSGLDLLPTKPRYAPYEELKHYGVKGMRWGIRKNKGSGSDGGKATRAKGESLSDDQLQTTVKRMQLERSYAQLVSKESERNAGRLERGRGAVADAMKQAGKEQMKNVFSKTLAVGTSYGIDRAISEAYNQPLLEDYAPRAEAIKKALTKKKNND